MFLSSLKELSPLMTWSNQRLCERVLSHSGKRCSVFHSLLNAQYEQFFKTPFCFLSSVSPEEAVKWGESFGKLLSEKGQQFFLSPCSLLGWKIDGKGWKIIKSSYALKYMWQFSKLGMMNNLQEHVFPALLVLLGYSLLSTCENSLK